MNTKLKRRLLVVTGVVVMVVVVVLALVVGVSGSKTVTVEQAASGEFNGKRVQVTGKVVDNSFSYDSDVLEFMIYDENADASKTVKVVYDKGVSTSFGNQITAICTGMIDAEGVLQCSELVTQCPSKYEGSTDALTVEQMSSYGAEIIGKPVKVAGTIKVGSMQAAGGDERFVVADEAGSSVELAVHFDGALSDEIVDGTVVVLSGAMDDNDRFVATDVAIRG